MNDPGLQDPINDVGDKVDGQAEEFDRAEEEEEKQFLDPTRWWFAATACPLIAGTFGPIASAFNICALGSYWREYVAPGKIEADGHFVQDPTWLLAVNAVSLRFALLGNLSLLFNMAGRARFEVAQPITILGFFTASVLLIGLVAEASTSRFQIKPYSEHALTQAFYYAIWAAAIYLIVSILMLATVVGALRGKYEKRFNLTTSQRTLMLQTISLMAYLLVGALIFSHVEGWNYLDAVYWADFTLLTIGIGSPFTPSTHTGRSLLLIYAIGGIVTIGLIIGSIRAMLLETGQKKMRARVTEKQRSRVHDFVRVKALGLMHLNQRPKRFNSSVELPEREKRRLEFHAMRDVQEKASRRGRYTSLAVSTMAGCVLWFIGALVFEHTEYKQGWSYFEALYFSYTSLLTIGYGDLSPYSNSGRAFFVLWSLLAIPSLTVLISDMGDTVVRFVSQATNLIGELTILPSDSEQAGAWTALKKNIWAKKPTKTEKGKIDISQEIHTIVTADRSYGDPSRHGDIAAILNQRLDAAELTVCRTFHRQSKDGSVSRDRRFHHWLLTREVGAVLTDTLAAPPKVYTYDEWAYFLMLLGHDEDEDFLHQSPNPNPTRGPGEGPNLGRIFDRDGNARAWSWLGIRSPLMSPKEEADWILHELIAKLNRELPLTRPTTHSGPHKPPISLDLLWPSPSGSEESGSRGQDSDGPSKEK
ncbi:MAG: Potassium channel [Chrysothrix sp. TS-e1954]|nr:MAG: Potassium channel [Chrysothrix sp. TS-e1954]